MTTDCDEEEASCEAPSRSQVKVREMNIDDLSDVFHLGEELFEADRVSNLYRTWDEFEVIDMFYGDPEFCIVAEYEDEIVGFALGNTITKSNSAWKYGHLAWLGVKKNYQRFGVAEKLFLRFKALMLKDGVRMLIVDTQAENAPAICFFEKLGFGNPIEHVYLTMNLDNERQIQKKKENGKKVLASVR